MYNAARDSREVMRMRRDDGRAVVDIRGSHHRMKHPTKPGKVSVPHPRKDIKPGTLRNIEKRSGIRLR